MQEIITIYNHGADEIAHQFFDNGFAISYGWTISYTEVVIIYWLIMLSVYLFIKHK